MRVFTHLLVLVTVFICGCVPCHYLQRPAALGTLVDARSGAPVAGAAVELSMLQAGRPRYSEGAMSGVDGSFTIPAKQRFGVWPTWAPIDPIICALTIHREGYQSYTNEFFFEGVFFDAITTTQATTNFQRISLESL